jgi:hydroxyethylthiazole kinase
VATQAVQAKGRGVGSLQMALLDQLQLLEEETFAQRLKLTVNPSCDEKGIA